MSGCRIGSSFAGHMVQGCVKAGDDCLPCFPDAKCQDEGTIEDTPIGAKHL